MHIVAFLFHFQTFVCNYRATLVTNQSFQLSWLTPDAVKISALFNSRSEDAPRVLWASSNSPTLTCNSLLTQAPVFPPPLGAFYPMPGGRSSHLAVALSPPVSVLLPTRAICKRPTDSGRDASAKQLCTGVEILRTSLETPTIVSRASPYRLAVVAGHLFLEAASML